MPIDLPAHNARNTYSKGNWVPVGWEPLHTSFRTRKTILEHIARRKLEARDKESQRNAAMKQRREKAEARERAGEELAKAEIEYANMIKRREDLARQKHDKFTQLKAVLKKETEVKNALEEKKRKEFQLLQAQQPALLAAIQAQQQSQGGQQQAQSNSLISQQNLMTQQMDQHISTKLLQQQLANANHQQMANQQLLRDKKLFQQQMSRPPPTTSSKPPPPPPPPPPPFVNTMLPPPPPSVPLGRVKFEHPPPPHHPNTAMAPPSMTHHIGSRPPTRTMPMMSPRHPRPNTLNLSPSPGRFSVPPPPIRHPPPNFTHHQGRQQYGGVEIKQDISDQIKREIHSPAPSPAPGRNYQNYPQYDAAAALATAYANYQRNTLHGPPPPPPRR